MLLLMCKDEDRQVEILSTNNTTSCDSQKGITPLIVGFLATTDAGSIKYAEVRPQKHHRCPPYHPNGSLAEDMNAGSFFHNQGYLFHNQGYLFHNQGYLTPTPHVAVDW